MHIYLLIDQSGSMITNWIETIGAVNRGGPASRTILAAK